MIVPISFDYNPIIFSGERSFALFVFLATSPIFGQASFGLAMGIGIA